MDKHNIENVKLTASAKKTLEDVTIELTDRVLQIAELKANSRNANEEISILDIIEAKEYFINGRIHQEKYIFKLQRISFALTFSGIIFASLGFLIFAYQSRGTEIYDGTSLIISVGFMSAFLGLIVTMVSMYRSILLHKNNLTNESIPELISNVDIVQRWILIEVLVSKILENRGENPEYVKSINSKFEFLTTILSSKDINKLQQLLHARNKIVHQNYLPSNNEKIELLDFANFIVKTLEKYE